MVKIAVVTSFPSGFPTAEAMLKSFDQFWPKDVDLFIDLDPMTDEQLQQARSDFADYLPNRQVFINARYSEARKKFLAEHKDEGTNYRFHVAKFSHKVFALYDVVTSTEYDFLIWLDADVITKQAIPNEKLESWLPKPHEAVTYLARTAAPHSECGFVAHNVNAGGSDIIKAMHATYVTDDVLALPGWTDCDVFDNSIGAHDKRSLYTSGGDGWHVFPHSELADYLEHYKGARKHGAQKQQPVMIDQLQVKTKNCVVDTLICENIKENIGLIKDWVQYCRPHDEDIIICSAGESLSYSDIKPWADKGAKIVTVKHAIDRLNDWKIKPWACVLLDPRQHVEKFVEKPDKDVIYFVASMVAPTVVRTLLDNGCTVIGYHAFVGAGERELLAAIDPKTMLVSGGSATATRCIGLLVECLGFKKAHCYGYDLCYFDRPDMTQKLPDGQPKYLEVQLGTQGWGNETHTRLFWTEGQFLAQAQELRDLCKIAKDFTIDIYGPGMAAWFFEHYKQNKAWAGSINKSVEDKRANAERLDEWLGRIRGNAA